MTTTITLFLLAYYRTLRDIYLTRIIEAAKLYSQKMRLRYHNNLAIFHYLRYHSHYASGKNRIK